MTAPPPAVGSHDSVVPSFWPWFMEVRRIARPHAWVVVCLTMLFPGMVIGARLIRGTEYEATLSIMPDESESPLSQMAGLAAQMGFAIPGGNNQGNSVMFYTTLMTSYDILSDVVTSDLQYVPTTGADPVRTNYMTHVNRGGTSRPDSVYRAVRYIERHIQAASAREAGVATLVIRADSPGLAVALSNRLIELVGEYNQQRRQSRARAEREFVEARLEETRHALDEAEKAVEEFRRTNRLTTDPGLELALERLNRTVRLEEQSYLQLSAALEQARINEVRDIPVFSVVESATTTVRRVGGLARDLAVSIVFGMVSGVMLAFSLGSYRSFRSSAVA